MKFVLPRGGWFLMLFLLLSAGIACGNSKPLTAEGPGQDVNEMKKAAAAMWAVEDFAGLERLAEQCRSENFEILTSYPAIASFYLVICGEAASDSEASAQFEKLQRWLQARPSSVTAKIALAHHFTSDAWRTRGAGWAHTVSSENWKLFHERILKAREAIYSREVHVEDDPTVAALRISIAMTGESQRSQTKSGPPMSSILWTPYFLLSYRWSPDRRTTDLDSAYADGIKAWPNYFPTYFNMQWAVLPRWCGESGEGAALAEKAAAHFSGETADGLYALLANAVFEPEGIEVFKSSGFDLARYLKGMDILAQRTRGNWPAFWRNRATYIEAVAGDPARARQRIFTIGPHTIPSAYISQLQVFPTWEKCGAMAELNKGAELERAGRLDEAETFYAGLNPEKPNPWVLSFALRNGIQRLWKPLYGTKSLSPEGADPNQLFELTTFHLCAGNRNDAKACAEAFDAVRPWNITGKYTLAYVAAVEGDGAGLASVREKFLALKTDRPNYRIAQRYVAGELKWEEARSQLSMDEYFTQACSAMAVFAIADGRPGEAKSICEEVHRYLPFEAASAFPESMLWGTLSRQYPLGSDGG